MSVFVILQVQINVIVYIVFCKKLKIEGKYKQSNILNKNKIINCFLKLNRPLAFVSLV